MNIKKLSLITVFIGSTLLLGGCEKQEPVTEPETVVDILVSPEALTETNTIPESAGIISPEETASASPEQTPASELAPALVPQPQNTASETPSAPNANTAKAEDASSGTPIAQNTTPETPKTESTASQTPKTQNTASDNFIPVSKDFSVSDTWISTISFQIPESWSYRADEDPSDWGFWIDLPDQKGFTLHIHALPGTFNVEGFYTAAPTDFETTSGMKGKFYRQKSAGDDNIPCIEGDIVFDQPSSGISFLANEDTYNQYMDTLQKVFLSVTIKDTYIE